MTDSPSQTPAQLRDRATKLLSALEAKVQGEQGGVPTFFDNYLHRTLSEALQLQPGLPLEQVLGKQGRGPQTEAMKRLEAFLARFGEGRFVDYRVRRVDIGAAKPRRSEIDPQDMRLSQGAWDCLNWRGLPLFKTVYDFAIYPMLLWEVRPRTVIELGSGSGASALWLADVMQVFGIEGKVVSLDLKLPEVSHPRVRFIKGDSERIDSAFPEMEMMALPHPWVVIEDAHVNVEGVLRHFHRQIRKDDYLVVEDSAIKSQALAKFLAETPGAYKLDTRYTDYFGLNATACLDSIFKRV